MPLNTFSFSASLREVSDCSPELLHWSWPDRGARSLLGTVFASCSSRVPPPHLQGAHTVVTGTQMGIQVGPCFLGKGLGSESWPADRAFLFNQSSGARSRE